MGLLVGADPEVFVKKGNGVVSAHGLIPGTKVEPHPVQNGAVQVDGMALEFNIDPSENEEAFVYNITSVLGQLAGMVPDHQLLIEATAEFDPAYLEAQPEEALLLGCDPDFNAYTAVENDAPDGDVNMRTAAGHIHMGWGDGFDTQDFGHHSMCCSLIKQMDIFLGLPSLLFDTDNKRRLMYGQAGAFRPKSYGVEYRVLSNKWLAEEGLMRYVYRNTKTAFDLLVAGRNLFAEGNDEANEIINSGSAKEAEKYLKFIPEVELYHAV